MERVDFLAQTVFWQDGVLVESEAQVNQKAYYDYAFFDYIHIK